MFIYVSFIFLCLLGILDTAYLVYHHYKDRNKGLVCLFNQNCVSVLESQFANLFWIRNDVLGLIFYIAILSAMIAALSLPQFSLLIQFAVLFAAVSAFIMSSILALVQIFFVKNYCSYCLFSAGLNILLLINATAFLRI